MCCLQVASHKQSQRTIIVLCIQNHSGLWFPVGDSSQDSSQHPFHAPRSYLRMFSGLWRSRHQGTRYISALRRSNFSALMRLTVLTKKSPTVVFFQREGNKFYRVTNPSQSTRLYGIQSLSWHLTRYSKFLSEEVSYASGWPYQRERDWL
jgi:hypothetical protein